MYKVMLSAGEASGDLHGAGIAAALKRRTNDEIRMFGMGGQAMRAADVEILYDIADYGVMGFVEVVKSLPKMFRLKDALVEVMKRERPDVLVIIDYPDFNWRLAKEAKALGIQVFSYIPPSAWAWRKGRAKSAAKIADKIAAIFPFETRVYEEAGADIVFVGNPLVDIVKPVLAADEAKKFFQIKENDLVILLLPGSRKQEIAGLLPIMLESAEKILAEKPQAKFFLPLASTIPPDLIEAIMSRYQVPIRLTDCHTYDLMSVADGAVAASGTVTLEAALVGLPTVVVYKMAPMTYFIASQFIHLPNYSLPNILAEKRVIPELIQENATATNVTAALLAQLKGTVQGNQVCAELKTVREKLGEPGAVERVAALIMEMIEKVRKV